jgi:hypothetical protein
MITSIVYTEIGPATYRITAVSSLADPVFRWFVDGIPYLTSTVGFIDVQLTSDTQLTIDVFDQDTANPNPLARGSNVAIAWEKSTGAIAYRVEQYVDPAWEVIDIITALDSRSFRKFVPADDEETISLRVVAIFADLSESVVATRLAFVVRIPDVPPQNYTLEDGILEIGG